MATARNHGLMLALAGIALLLAATRGAYRPPTALGPVAPPGVFSAYRAKAILRDLVGNGVPHPIGSAADAGVREAIVKRLSALGYATELQSGFVCNDDGVCGNPVNIVARLRPGSADQDAVLLAAHYDSVPAGPGASDDGAAVATVLEIARILAALPPPPHPIVLLISDGEEAGLLGALLFVREHPLSKQVKAAVNLDARGTSGLSLMFETGSANTWLMSLYGSAIARPVTNSLYYVVYKQLQNDTDFTVFKGAGYQGFNFAFVGNVGRYHTPLDNAANASPSSIQHQGDNALSALLALANSPTLHPPIAESVFLDGFARVLIAWPSEFTLPAALLALAVLLAEACVLLRKGTVSGREVWWGWVGTLCVLVFGTALCAGLLVVLVAVGKVPPIDGASWISQPLPMHFAAAAIALLAAGAASAWFARRAGFWGFWVAAALFGAVLSVAGAVAVPGASFVLLLTAIAAGLGGLPFVLATVSSRTPAGWATDIAALLPALVIFAAEFPLLQFMYVALGSLAWPLSTLVLCLGTITLLPLLAVSSVRARQRVIVLTALMSLGGFVVTLYLPTYSAEWPERINVEYWFDADTGESNYLARPASLRLPAALIAAAHFDPVPRPRFAGSRSLAFYAAAPRLALAVPELTLASQPTPASLRAAVAQSIGAPTHFDLRLRSARGAPEALVVFPASARVADIELATAKGPVRVKLSKLRSGATLLDIVGLPAAGVEFSAEAAGPLPLAIQVFDQSYDFPEGQILQRVRPTNATSSQDGDLTVAHRTVSLDPTTGR
jgi:Peptidase family M28